MFAPSDYLTEAISKGDIIEIHNELCCIIHKDPGFKTNNFNDALNYIKEQNIPNIIQTHDDRSFEPREKWNKEYWALLVSDLMDNFSLERIQHIKEVSYNLFGSKVQYDKQQTSYVKPSTYRQTGNDDLKKLIPIAAIAGVALVGVAAIGIKKAALIAGAAVVIGGAVLVARKMSNR